MGFAVVGCGTVSGYGHLPAIAALKGEGAQLAAVADLSEDRLREVCGKYPGAPGFTDYRKALALKEVDAVVIATLLDTHAPIALEALRAGKHVLVEKPPARTPEECRALVEAAESAQRICAVDFDLRFQRSFFEMRNQYKEGVIGKLRAVRVIFDWYGADHRNPKSGRQARLMRDGTIMFTEGIHFVDLVRWITGREFAKVHCVGTNIQGHANLDHMALIGTLEDGTVVVIESSHGYGFSSKDATMDRQMDLIGDGGVIKWSAEKGRIVVHGCEKTFEIGAPDRKEFVPLYQELVKSIRQGRPTADLPTIRDGHEVLKVVYAADREAREGKGGS
jgi:predicted dehydrogenase